MRKAILLSGAALAIARDLYLVNHTAAQAQERADAAYTKAAEELAARTKATSLELTTKMCAALDIATEDKDKWAYDLRYLQDLDVAILMPLHTQEEREQAEDDGATLN